MAEITHNRAVGDQARQSLALMAILITGFFLIFFPIAPYIGFTALAEDVWRVPQIVLPVFIGYLASAIYFVFGQTEPTEIRPGAERLFGILLYGPFAIFLLGTLALIASFFLSHRPSAPPDSGISTESLAGGFSVLLSLLTGTTTFISQFLFGSRKDD
jgi:hypothetical protein